MLIDVTVPEIAIDSLTYESVKELEQGCRVIVEVGRTLRTGFVLGRSEKNLPPNVTVKPVKGIIDNERIIDADIWDLAVWCGKVSMCGTAVALKTALPAGFYTGEKTHTPPKNRVSGENFTERNCFNPLDEERVKFFLAELDDGKRSLIIFPRKEQAVSFFSLLPENLKSQALLWPSHNSSKLWEAWNKVIADNFRIVVSPPGGVFAPLMPQKIIVEDEANPAYVIPYTLNLSARSLAGHRAVFLNADFITAGRIPSLKTYFRKRPVETLKPDRKNIILADIHQSKKETLNGIEGIMPLTYSLIKHTYRALIKGNNVIWILNRAGEASEVFCTNCGNVIRCKNCGSIMQAKNDGNILRCRTCGRISCLPDKCEKCGYAFFLGRRPGIEALAKITGKYYSDVHIFTEGSEISDMHGLILSTQKGLELCGKINPSLIAWLDLDAELRRPEYSARFNVFSMLCESYWLGRNNNVSERKVLIQARSSGMKLAEFLAKGWSKFIPFELRERQEFLLPPFGYIVEIECSSKILFEEILNLFMDAGIFVMDPGDDKNKFYVNSSSLETVREILAPKFFLRNTKKNYIKITVKGE